MVGTLQRHRGQQILLFLVNLREVGVVLFTSILIVFVSLRQPRFLTASNFQDIAMDIAILAIVSIGQMMVLIIRGIDLSVGSIIGLVAMSIGLLIRDQTDFPVIITIFLGIGMGLVLGSINGLIITKWRVPPIIATLGTLSIYRGVVIVISQGEWIDTYRLPDAFMQITRFHILGIPTLVVFAVILACLFYVFLNYMRVGREIYALGSNPTAAQVSGIRTAAITFLVFALSGALAGLGGVLWASRFASVVNDTGAGFEFQTVTAAVIGGVNVYGGAGTIPGVFLGALLLGIIVNALTITGISPFWRLTVQGLLILFAVIIDAAINRRLNKVS